ncbi:MAG: Rpn family recombination-promoting nuclease/putative transposase [Bacteroidetes bacterium]|nr:MAG: Rpn family recombination-promoting nuclease/putative transposase [Bacteroidota bacterium]
MKEKFINPFTDFGFKKLFGEENNKDLLIDFLNELLKNESPITDLTFLKTENLGATEADRKAIFDLYCQNSKGQKFIVELQKAKQKHFKDRSIYYSSFPIQEQAQKGDWDYELKAVYTVSIMDFKFDDLEQNESKLRHDVQLMEIETKKVFYEKLRFVYLEMPKFTKTIDQLENHYEKWLFLLKNLSKLDAIPEKLREKIFIKLFEVAEIAKYNDSEQRAYQDSLKYYRDLKNVMNTVFEEGQIDERKKIVKALLLSGVDLEIVAKATKLSIQEIETIINSKENKS